MGVIKGDTRSLDSGSHGSWGIGGAMLFRLVTCRTLSSLPTLDPLNPKHGKCLGTRFSGMNSVCGRQT